MIGGIVLVFVAAAMTIGPALGMARAVAISWTRE